jgi:hypothetical protein
MDKTQIQISSVEAWLWIVTREPVHHRILGIYISRHRYMLVAGESFLRSLVNLSGKHIVDLA